MSDLYRKLGLTVMPPSPPNAREPDLLPYDVEQECEHGRLPTDAGPACRCWEGEERDPRAAGLEKG